MKPIVKNQLDECSKHSFAYTTHYKLIFQTSLVKVKFGYIIRSIQKAIKNIT